MEATRVVRGLARAGTGLHGRRDQSVPSQKTSLSCRHPASPQVFVPCSGGFYTMPTSDLYSVLASFTGKSALDKFQVLPPQLPAQ